MKRLILLTIILIATSAIFQSCGVFSEIGESKEKSVPFSETEFQSNRDYYKALGRGKSPSMSFAREIALHDAKERLAKKIFHDNPHNEMTENVIHQELMRVDVLKEEVFVLDNGLYVCWIIVRTPREHY